MWNNNDGATQGSSRGRGRTDGGGRGFQNRRGRGFGTSSWRGGGRGKHTMYGKGKLNDHHLEDIVGPSVTEMVDMTPVPSTVYDSAVMSWMVPAPPPPPPEPFKFEPPETDEHLEALAFMQLLKEDRQLLKDWNQDSTEYFDCRGLHGIGQMCQFCDGRRGPWARKAKRNEPEAAFLKYQESVINSLQGRKMDPAEGDALNPSKLGSLGDDSKFDFADAEFGVNSNSLSILG
ncbi:unnamed protein product [Orchesella dallaii]|uniref:Uncharacterized protein n=1 Tax=Orchesella dallaii TaxID=48710 RepID=A0ABP1S6R7_9HEXA